MENAKQEISEAKEEIVGKRLPVVELLVAAAMSEEQDDVIVEEISTEKFINIRGNRLLLKDQDLTKLLREKDRLTINNKGEILGAVLVPRTEASLGSGCKHRHMY